MKKLIILLFAASLLTSCTSNELAKEYGGSITKQLPANQKLVNITWKEQNLWILTRPMTEADSATSYTFQEDSKFGVLQGTVTIVETKK